VSHDNSRNIAIAPVIAVAFSAGLILKDPHQVPQPPPHASSGIAQIAKAFLFMARSLGSKNDGAVYGWTCSVGLTRPRLIGWGGHLPVEFASQSIQGHFSSLQASLSEQRDVAEVEVVFGGQMLEGHAGVLVQGGHRGMRGGGFDGFRSGMVRSQRINA
jgi:hypothetical protein